MKDNHKLALYIAYYLSRFNIEGLQNLGYSTWNEAFSDISRKLNVNFHSVRNWRDEFDPLFNHRAGWYKRNMSPSRIKIAQSLQDLNEFQIRSLIEDILSGRVESDVGYKEILIDIAKASNLKDTFIIRGPTGRAAEEFFIKFYNETHLPINGKLVDCRDLGCGYDFEIISNSNKSYIEVKGLSELSGGILFTDKEWRTAKSRNFDYFLCVVRNISSDPIIQFIKNPSLVLAPVKNIYSTIQINWSIPQIQLQEIT